MAVGSGDLQSRVIQGGVLLLAAAVGVLAGFDPKLAVAAALGLIFAMAVLGDLAIGIALFAFISFIDVMPLGGAPSSLIKIIGALLLVSWLATLVTRSEASNDFVSAHPVITYVLILFVAWVLASQLWAEAPGDALSAAVRYGLNMVMFLIVFTAVRSPKHVAWIMGAFVAGATLAVIVALLSPTAVDPGGDISRLGEGEADPNKLASLAVCSIAFAAAFGFGMRRGSNWRALALLSIPICLFGVFLTLSRGGLVALAVGLVVAIVVGGRWRTASLGLTIGLVAVLVAVIGFVATPDERTRLTTSDGGSGRTDIWTVGLRMVEANPVLGVGAGNFPVTSVHYLLEPGAIQRDDYIVDEPKVAHNMYLGVLAELGVVGALLFATMLAFSLTTALRAAHIYERLGQRQMEMLSRTLVVALSALLAADFFLSEEYSKQLWLLMALGPAILAMARRMEQDPGAVLDAA